jgi:hypothetical protein
VELLVQELKIGRQMESNSITLTGEMQLALDLVLIAGIHKLVIKVQDSMIQVDSISMKLQLLVSLNTVLLSMESSMISMELLLD